MYSIIIIVLSRKNNTELHQKFHHKTKFVFIIKFIVYIAYNCIPELFTSLQCESVTSDHSTQLKQ